jgi:hypothetical protein
MGRTALYSSDLLVPSSQTVRLTKKKTKITRYEHFFYKILLYLFISSVTSSEYKRRIAFRLAYYYLKWEDVAKFQLLSRYLPGENHVKAYLRYSMPCPSRAHPECRLEALPLKPTCFHCKTNQILKFPFRINGLRNILGGSQIFL